MVYFSDPQTFLEQSTLLLQARPTTTKITTRYSLTRPSKTTSESNAAAPQRPRGVLVVKTYDPVSGTCLKYRTNKAAEVGRLVGGLGRCSRTMAALPPQAEDAEGDAIMGGAEPDALARGATEPKAEGKAEGVQQLQQGGGGGGKKKKKGKK